MASAQRRLGIPAGSLGVEVRQLARTLLPTQIEAAVNLTRAFLRNLTANTDPAPPFPCASLAGLGMHSHRQEPAFGGMPAQPGGTNPALVLPAKRPRSGRTAGMSPQLNPADRPADL